MKTATKTEPIQITFKLDQEWFRPLKEEAEGLGISPNIAAREHVIRALTGDRSELSALREEVAALRAEIGHLGALFASLGAARTAEATGPSTDLREMRLDLATAVAAILAELRPQATPDEIATWVKANLLRKAA